MPDRITHRSDSCIIQKIVPATVSIVTLNSIQLITTEYSITDVSHVNHFILLLMY